MAEGDIPGVKVVAIKRSVLTTDEAWICIVQVPPVFSPQDPDASNPGAVQFVQGLLAAGGNGHAPLDTDCDKPDALRILVLPELGFGSGDWDALDAAVRGYNKPLMLVAAFGFTPLGQIKPKVDFIEGNPSDDRSVNFGCCWISLPARGTAQAETHAIYYCKNFSEQSAEKTQYNPIEGTSIVSIEFDDLTVFPIICADILQTSNGSPLERIIARQKYRNVPSILIASLLQREPWHGIWKSRLDAVASSIKGVVAVANIAQDVAATTHEQDVFRNLSGVYTAVARHTSPPHATFCSSVRHEETLTGHPIRHAGSIAVAGSVRLDNYSPTEGRHIWHPAWARRLENGAISAFEKECVQFDAPRLLKRVAHATNPSIPLERVDAYLKGGNSAKRRQLFASAIFGLESPPAVVDPCLSLSHSRASEFSLRGTDALMECPEFSWPENSDSTLTVSLPDLEGTAIDVYVWRSATKTWQSMQSELLKRANDVGTMHRPVIVFAADVNNTSLERDLIQRDIGQPAPEVERDTTTVKKVREHSCNSCVG